MGSIFTIIASGIAAAASIFATIVVLYQGKKNRRLTSIINYKINCLDLTVTGITKYINTILKLVELDAKRRSGYITVEEEKEDWLMSQKLILLTYEINVYLNYQNKISDELSELITQLSNDKSTFLSLEGDDYNDATQRLDFGIDNVILSVKKYIEEEWKQIDKSL